MNAPLLMAQLGFFVAAVAATAAFLRAVLWLEAVAHTHAESLQLERPDLAHEEAVAIARAELLRSAPMALVAASACWAAFGFLFGLVHG